MLSTLAAYVTAERHLASLTVSRPVPLRQYQKRYFSAVELGLGRFLRISSGRRTWIAFRELSIAFYAVSEVSIGRCSKAATLTPDFFFFSVNQTTKRYSSNNPTNTPY